MSRTGSSTWRGSHPGGGGARGAAHGVRWATALAVLLGLAACGGPTAEPEPTPTPDPGKGDSGGSDRALRRALDRALEVMRARAAQRGAPAAPLAAATRERIVRGDVRVRSLGQPTRDDYLRIRRDCRADYPDECDFPESHTAFLAGSAEAEFVLERYDGWMWGERIYVSVRSLQRTSAAELAATLVHETNHVLNRSEENYYRPAPAEEQACTIDDVGARLEVDPAQALREEYRAFYAEYLFSDAFAGEINALAGVAGSGRATERTIRSELAAYVRELYGIASEVRLAVDVGEDRLVPDARRWATTRVAAARPEAIYACE
jgi:hypothetical protein